MENMTGLDRDCVITGVDRDCRVVIAEYGTTTFDNPHVCIADIESGTNIPYYTRTRRPTSTRVMQLDYRRPH